MPYLSRPPDTIPRSIEVLPGPLWRTRGWQVHNLPAGAVLIVDARAPWPGRWVEIPPGEHAFRFRMRLLGARKRGDRYGLRIAPRIDALCAMELDRWLMESEHDD